MEDFASGILKRVEVLAVENAVLRERLRQAQEEIERRDQQIEALRGDANEETYEDA